MTLALVGVAKAPAQQAGAEPELVTDRPDQTESAAVVPRGSVQVEVGWARERDDEGGVETRVESAAATLVRVGLADRLELRLGWDGHLDEEVRAGGLLAEASGAGDASLGVKVRLADDGPRRPEAALLLGVSLPVGARRLTSDRYDPAFRFAVARTLSDRLSLAANLGMSWTSAPGAGGAVETASSLDYTIALGTALSDRLGAFVEVFGAVPVDRPAGEDGGSAHSFDGGLTYLLGPRLQLDLAAGVGLSDDAPDAFLGVGVSARFDRPR